ncbi:MAG: hypothetical protein SGCHY_001057 [Lobulomycetales sp.]
MILLSELSRRRIRSIQKLIRVGRNEVVIVLRVDKDKGYIDLSKRRVSPEDIAACEDRYNRGKTVHSIMRHVADRLNLGTYSFYLANSKELEDFYQNVGWKLYKKYGHAFDAFKLAISNADAVFQGLEITPEAHKELLSTIRKRLTPQAIKIRADVEVSCFGYLGIDAVRGALQKGEASASTESASMKIKLVAPPLYVMTANATDKNEGISMLETAISVIEKEIMAVDGGSIDVKMRPRAVNESDDAELEALMAKASRENNEISGDEDDDDEGSDDE